MKLEVGGKYFKDLICVIYQRYLCVEGTEQYKSLKQKFLNNVFMNSALTR